MDKTQINEHCLPVYKSTLLCVGFKQATCNLSLKFQDFFLRTFLKKPLRWKSQEGNEGAPGMPGAKELFSQSEYENTACRGGPQKYQLLCSTGGLGRLRVRDLDYGHHNYFIF